MKNYSIFKEHVPKAKRCFYVRGNLKSTGEMKKVIFFQKKIYALQIECFMCLKLVNSTPYTLILLDAFRMEDTSK